MEAKLLKRLSKKLLKEKKKILLEIERLKNRLSDLNTGIQSELSHNETITDDHLPGNVDSSINITDRQLGLYYDKICEITWALSKIKNAKEFYGVCELCHNPIDINRLKMIPEARYCIGCQRLIEFKSSYIQPESLSYRSKWWWLYNLIQNNLRKFS